MLTAVQQLNKMEGGFLHPTRRAAQGAGHQLWEEGMLYGFTYVLEALQLRGPRTLTARLFGTASKGARCPLCAIFLISEILYHLLSFSLFTLEMSICMKMPRE